MKWLLISVALNIQMTYPDQNVCNQALEQVKTQDMNAICIPKGEDKMDSQMNSVFNNFLGLVKELQKMELNSVK
tara:strand:- start:325 stop:546 length:222 start_codon:yes stop_codon:yes gene_type:complete